ncbi:Lysosomal acid phosphatase, partial [Stegodyphus mimosarum]
MWFYLILALLFTCAISKQDQEKETYQSEQEIYRGKLIYLQILTSNGFYSPLEIYPTDENKESAWPQGLTKLTKLGMLQQYQLGKFLRKVYGDFITSDPTEVETFSAADDRTLESALCFLASLYSPTKEWRFVPKLEWQPVPVPHIEGPYDRFLGYLPYCPRMFSEIRKIIKSQPGQEFINKDEFLYSFWANNSGMPMNDWNDVTRLFDTLQRENNTGLEVPEWAKLYWHEMKRITDAAYRWNHNSRVGLKLKIGPLLELMTERLKFKTLEDDPNRNTKVNVYVTHDWNIVALLMSTFRFNGLRPPPCATIIWELYQRYNNYQVRMLYYNSSTPELGYQDPFMFTVRGCTEYCPLAYFINFFRDYIPKDWNKLCGLKKVKSLESDESGRPFSLSDEKNPGQP